MLMVVFGAGASYDSIDVKPPGTGNPGWAINEEFRPPLAADLFGFRALFADVMGRLRTLRPIIPILRRTGGKNIETVLRGLQDEAVEYPERHRQLMAVRYYLQVALWQCTYRWIEAAKNVTNYEALLDQINRWHHGEPVSLVTFNYDTLLENAMPTVGLTITRMEDYVFANPGYQVFKLHGSTDWARIVAKDGTYASGNAWSIVQEHIDLAASLKITENFVRITQYPCGLWENRVGLVPAIAIPVEQKSYFECPKSHLDQLKRMLPAVDKLLFVGWRATEEHFLTLLKDHLKGSLSVQVVAGSEAEARLIMLRLHGGLLSELDIHWHYAPSGFTDFVVNRRVDELLKR
jgi:hypothetical protein